MANSALFETPGDFSADLLSILEEDRNRGDEEGAASSTRRLLPEEDPERPRPALLVSQDPEAMARAAERKEADVRPLGDGLFAADLSPTELRALVKEGAVREGDLMKQHYPQMDLAPQTIGFPFPDEPQFACIDGRDVLVAVVDTGFDLSHPCFRDANGRLRVEALYDQTTGRGSRDWRAWSTEELERGWIDDRHGAHGTHVASIAGGTPFGTLGLGGIARGVRYLLVQTDFLHLGDAWKWVYAQAKRLGRPCVVNFSGGHHDGAHDGTHIEERGAVSMFSEPGMILVTAAGNSAARPVHVSAVLDAGVSREVRFRAKTSPLKLGGWYSQDDEFDIEVVPPPSSTAGGPFHCPAAGAGARGFEVAGGVLTLARAISAHNRSIEVAVCLQLAAGSIAGAGEGWSLRITGGRRIISGAIDFYIASKWGEFHDSSLIDRAGTVSIPATAKPAIAVGSYSHKGSWPTDQGTRTIEGWNPGVSSFSGRGPTRSGLQRPDLLAPGEWVTAAGGRAAGAPPELLYATQNVLTDYGTSQAAPVVSGTIALMLQINRYLTGEQARSTLIQTARKRQCTCSGTGWCSACGWGVLDAVAAVRASLE